MKESAAPSTEPAFKPLERTPFQRYGFALAATLCALLVRLGLDPHLPPNKNVFVTFIVATTAVSWYSGFVPSLFTFVLGFIAADWFFLDPRHSIGIGSASVFETLAPPIFVSITIILFGRKMHEEREKAESHTLSAIRGRRLLEQEVAERKRAEEEISRLNAELERRVEQRTAELVVANEELESFTYSVSHDLRAPLRHVDGYAQILEEEFGPKLPADAQNFTRKIRQSSHNMGRLVDDLLNLSRIGKKELTCQRTPLNPIVENVVSEITQDAPNREIQWRIGELPAVNCDPGLIKQVFVNLISNSVKYTRPKTPATIEIGLNRQPGESTFFVRDNGVGFNMKYSAKLFGVFQRLHRVEEFEGTGVGLATVARIIRKHGGKIWAEAEVGKGATFYFTLAGLSPEAAS